MLHSAACAAHDFRAGDSIWLTSQMLLQVVPMQLVGTGLVWQMTVYFRPEPPGARLLMTVWLQVCNEFRQSSVGSSAGCLDALCMYGAVLPAAGRHRAGVSDDSLLQARASWSSSVDDRLAAGTHRLFPVKCRLEPYQLGCTVHALGCQQLVGAGLVFRPEPPGARLLMSVWLQARPVA